MPLIKYQKWPVNPFGANWSFFLRGITNRNFNYFRTA